MATASSSVLYETSRDGKVAHIVLNRPEHFNAIDKHMPQGIRAAVQRANADPAIHCIVVRGAGPGFCGGYDLQAYAQHAERGTTDGSQDVTKGYDPLIDYQSMKENTECFSDLFHSAKPTIAQIHGAAVAGGSDIALCCDLVVMAEDARIGYPPARVWGCPTTAMWAVRLGVEKAKRMLFTGDLIDGREAERMGLILKTVPATELDSAVKSLTDRIATVPCDQNWMHKQVINGFVEGQVLGAQKLATIFDGITRNSPAGIGFQTLAQSKGFKEAVAARDRPGRTEKYMRTWKSVL
jgi:enoyl-CoA hydratase